MAIDFMTALRSRARTTERSARLSGRPLTQTETVAPYIALAETAGERLRAGKSVELAERGQVASESQFGQQLEETRLTRAENARMEADRLAESKRAEEERIAFQNKQLAEEKRATNLQWQAAQEAQEVHTSDRIKGGITGGLGGYAASSALYAMAPALFATGPVGPLIVGAGALLGFLGGGKKGCIIISACTDPYSYEVNLARRFRDRFMGPETLIGYYALASVLAPYIDRFRLVRWLAYRMLVKRLVDYGEWVLNGKKRKRSMSEFISKIFLNLCGKLGRRLIHA